MDPLIKSPARNRIGDSENADSGDPCTKYAPNGAHDEAIVRIVALWPDLPEPIRAALLTLAESGAVK